MNLEKEPISYDLDDAEVPGYLDVGKWHVAAIVVLVGLVGLVAAGVISIPQLDGNPSIEDPPGNGEYAAGIDLADAEGRVLDEVDAYRAENGASALAADDELDAIATYHNRHRAVAAYDDDASTPRARDDYEKFDYRCPRKPVLLSVPAAILGVDGSIDAYESESDLAESVAAGLVENQSGDASWLADRDAAAVDLHVHPDGNVYVAVAAC